ncbi:hypothetical protein J5226_16190 [Lysobacter sp. K5869]|uniref:hypothetical protein n=1 Tax=Lysobacter sp. K5869 TaxID=2820808 RepID=UPI001C063568|nr:hypothetical protein [Lysobacter sp. K5869]QWP75159.1 hypothetical protein J5226_16190 [Lysobacter sp. K5869]
MTAATFAGSRALPALVRVALAAAVLAAAGCKDPGVAAGANAPRPADQVETPAVDPSTDPALNHGGTTPHDTPPLATRDPLLDRADAALRKADPNFDKYEVNYAVGDLDGDGRDDVAVDYGVGEEGAMHHAAKSVRVLLAREDGLQLQPDQTDAFEYCPAVRAIRDGRLWADGLEACILPFPKTLSYYQFEWRDGALKRVSEQDAQERSLARLQAMREAIEAGKPAAIERNLRPGPLRDPPDGTQPPPNRAFADAKIRRAFADTVGMLSHLELRKLNDREFSASLVKPGAGERSLHIDLAPENEGAEVEGYTYPAEAVVTLAWPDSNGVGYRTRWYLIEGELYLDQAGQFDPEGVES